MAVNSKELSAVQHAKEPVKSSIPIIKWLVTFGIPVLFYFSPIGLDPTHKIFLALTFFAVTAWVTEVMPNDAVGMLLPVLYVVFNVAPADVAFSPWFQGVIWMTLGALIMGTAMIRTGVCKRIAYWSILRVGGGIKGMMWGLALCGVILAIVVPANVARLSILIPFAVGICQALNIEAKTKDASAIMLAAFFAVSCPGLGVLTGNGQNLLANGVFGQAMGFQVSWATWLMHNMVPALVWTLIAIAATIFVLKPGTHGNSSSLEEIRKRYQAMGKVRSAEYKVIVVAAIIVIGFLTQSIHGLDPNMLFILAYPLYFMPKMDILEHKDFNSTNVLIIFFIAGAMSIGAVAGHIKLTTLISDNLVPYLSGSAFKMVSLTWLFGTVLNFFLTPLAIVATFTGLMAQMAVQLGVNPEVILYTLLYAADTYIFPYEFAFLLFVMSFGYLAYKDIIKVMLLRTVGAGLFIVLVAYPFWKLIGLL